MKIDSRMPQIKSWTVSDAFWARVDPLIPLPATVTGSGLSSQAWRWSQAHDAAPDLLPPSFMCCAPAANGRLFLASLAAPVQSICIFRSGNRQASSFVFGKPDWPSMTRWKPLHGTGRVSTARCTKRRWRPNAWVPTPRIGGKIGRKPSLLVDAIGIPLSRVVSGANTHDVKLLEATLDQIVMEMPDQRDSTIFAPMQDTRARRASNAAVERDYKPHIKQRREEAHEKLTTPGFKARRWVVGRTHSWINRFRKLLVSFEKTEASYVALLSLACTMICWRQTAAIHG